MMSSNEVKMPPFQKWEENMKKGITRDVVVEGGEGRGQERNKRNNLNNSKYN